MKIQEFGDVFGLKNNFHLNEFQEITNVLLSNLHQLYAVMFDLE